MGNLYIVFSAYLLTFLFCLSINNVFSLPPPPVPTNPFSGGNIGFSIPGPTGSLADSLNVLNDLSRNNDDDTPIIVPGKGDETNQLKDFQTIINRELLGLSASTQSQERAFDRQLNDDIKQRLLAQNNLITKKTQELIQRDDAVAQTTAVRQALNPPTSVCDTTKYDLAVHEIDGKADLRKVLQNLNDKKDKDVIFQMILDNDPTETSLVLLDTLSTNLKGKIIVGALDSDPKEFDYDIEKVHTDCMETTAIDKTKQIESKIDKPLVITNFGSQLLEGPTGSGARSAIPNIEPADGGGQIFQECTTSDFAKYSIVANGKNLANSGDANGNKVNLKIKLVVDLDRSPLTSKNAATVIDDNRILAFTLIANEGKSNEEIFKFIPISINTECKTVSFLEQPVDIADKDEFPNPLYGFKIS